MSKRLSFFPWLRPAGWLLWLFIVVFASIGLGASTNEVYTNAKALPVQLDFTWFHDPDGEIDVSSASLMLDQFVPTKGRFSFPASQGSYWIHVWLTPAQETERLYLLELSFSQLDQVDFYYRSDDQLWQHQFAGDRFPVGSGSLAYRYPLFEFERSAQYETEVLLRVKSSTAILIPLNLWGKPGFEDVQQRQNVGAGLYYGVLLALVVYNLFLYPTVRDTTYLWFAFYLGSFALFFFAFEGYARVLLWPDSPLMADRAVSVFIWLTMAGGLRFTQKVSLSDVYLTRSNWIFTLLALIAFVFAVLNAVVGPQWLFHWIAPFGALVALIIPLPLVIAWRRGYTAVRFALLAFLPIFPGAILIAARTADLIESSYYTENLFSLGTALSALLLSFALADRINLLREEKLVFQQQLTQTAKQASEARQQFSTQLIETQDIQRRQIAAELHDGVGQNLSVLANIIHSMDKNVDARVIQRAQDAVHQSLDEVRAISHQLHPYILDQIGLVSALEAITDRVVVQGDINCQITIDDCVEKLPAATQLHLYRITQEAISNILKHSSASSMWIEMECCDDRIMVSIRDNGVGLPAELEGTGLGLESIRQRVDLLQGVLQFAENLPSGVNLRIELPMN